MNKDVVKYGLIGAAIYFAWPYISDWFKGFGGGAVAATGGGRPTGTESTNPTQAPPVVVPPPSGNVSVLTGMDNDAVSSLAAQGNANAVTEANRRGITHNWDQWNWYRALTQGAQPDPLSFLTGSRTDNVPVSAYLAARHAAGLSGMGELGELGFIHPALMWMT